MELFNIVNCIECKKDFDCQTDLHICINCQDLYDLDKLWEYHDLNKLDALDFNESEKFREQFKIK